MIWFWGAIALVSAGAAALIVHRAARAARARAGENPWLAVYRRQVAEIDELAGRGLLADAERRGVRAETGRRLLAAAERPDKPLGSARPVVILALAASAPLAAFAVYLAIGAPGLPDQPFARRLARWSDTPIDNLSPPQLAALMRAAAAKNPTDPGPLYFMARYELDSGQPMEAFQALDRAIALAPQRADLWDLKGEVALNLSRGDLNGEARTDFERALALDPRSPAARFHFANEKIESGDVKAGLAEWRSLEADLDPSDPRRRSLAGAIAEVETSGGAPLSATAPPGVSGAQIQGMVDGLAQRLKANPDDPEGWVRLVRAYAVLGETAQRDAALAEARRRYAGRADILSQLDAALHPQS